ncbi:arsenicals resistance [Metarhizium acridum]|uniref:Arsenite efflux transporter, putative n=1 Tax=Metarhizium acridum (strain CQMa 102) TaxID=655827 RepID=E9E2F2_METAQ|nr:arsenite efflux transporter, putative [Metarhizium acridum CQMa 102]EFY89841.1 arsenite efflux transporter, putative [Metarhizium acridum CQMa 102]KAG8424738.1 arsenicals resistance [Metarhizium acridum]
MAEPTPNDTKQRDTEKQSPACAQKVSAFKSLGWLDRFLAIWIFLAMLIGILLGNFVPSTERVLQQGHWVGVSIPIAIGLLVMMYPILCNVRYETLHQILGQKALWTQVLFSIVFNWLVAPFFMVHGSSPPPVHSSVGGIGLTMKECKLGLAWAFLPDEPNLRNGLILVGLGRCIAMVLIWNGLAGGDAEYCAILVAINSMLQMVLFAPMAVFFIRVIGRPASDDVAVQYSVVATSVGVFLGIPLGAAIITRLGLRHLAGEKWYNDIFMKFLSPWSLIGLLYTIIVLFAAQGKHVVRQIVSVVRVAAPLVVYFLVIFFVTLWATRRLGYGYRLGCTQSFTAASNNFELAIAVAVATFGADSEQALAATVGPLIEVPVLVGLVYFVRWIGRRWKWDE